MTNDAVSATLDRLRSESAEELNNSLLAVSGPGLFAGADSGQRADLMELLGRTRREELGPAALARVIHGIQAGRRSPARDAILVEILLSRGGADLTRLKNFTNTAEDHQDLEDLVFFGLSESDRDRVLAHFAAEAQGRIIKDPKILSDIDDTVFCKLHDHRWPRGMIYPGVLSLFEALDRGGDDDPFDLGDLTFVTARPADAWGLVETWSRATLHRAGVSRLSVLSGSFRALLTKDAMATRKLENIARYRRLFPEYQLVFLGDSGQGDVLVGERLIQVEAAAVRLVLIHDVVNTPEEVRAEYAAKGIYFHDTYVGAAAVAYEHGLISRDGLLAVAKEAVAGEERTRWENIAQRTQMRAFLDRDLARLEDLADPPALH